MNGAKHSFVFPILNITLLLAETLTLIYAGRDFQFRLVCHNRPLQMTSSELQSSPTSSEQVFHLEAEKCLIVAEQTQV